MLERGPLERGPPDAVAVPLPIKLTDVLDGVGAARPLAHYNSE